MKLLIISSLIWFAATTVRTCLGHPSAGAGPSLLRREEPIPDNGDTPPAEWEVVRDYRKTFQNADGGWAEGEEAARVCVKYFIRESLVKNVKLWSPYMKLVNVLEGCLKRHKAEFINIDRESFEELQDASTDFFKKFRAQPNARQVAAETFGFNPRATPRRRKGSRRRRPPKGPPKWNGPFNIATSSLEETGKSFLSAFKPRQSPVDEEARSSGAAWSAWPSGARAVPLVRPI